MRIGSYQEAAQALANEAARLWGLMGALRQRGLGSSQTWAIDELSSYDQHTGDQGTETFERAKDVGLMAHTYQQLEQVARAWQRLQEGTYGACEECGRSIDQQRLQALPAATLCLSCKEERESRETSYGRPVEEEVLFPPFYRSFDVDSAGIDGEDVWQELAKFGTANSPQDIPDSVELDDAYINADEDQGIVESVEGVLDIGYRTVTNQGMIYPDLHENPRRQPYQIEWRLPGEDDTEAGQLGWSPWELGWQAEPPSPEDLGEELWGYVQQNFPGDPEMEMAQELSPQDLEEIALEYERFMREDEKQRQ